jgi:hypothetical protein
MKRVLGVVAALVCAVVLFAATPGTSHATTVLKVSVEEMTRTSDWVVRARVLGVANVDLQAEGKGLFTDVELAIDEVLRGKDVPSRYVLRLLGGVGKNRLAMAIPGMPRFVQGEEVVLFLEKTSVGHVPSGLGQGVWRVVRTPASMPLVLQSTADMRLMKRAPSGAIVEAPMAPPLSAKLLGELAREVRAVAARATP